MSATHHTRSVPSFSVPFYSRTTITNPQPVTPPESPLESMTKSKKQTSRIRLTKVLKRPHLTRTSSTLSQTSTTTATSEEPFQAIPNTGDIPPMPQRIPFPLNPGSQNKEPFPVALPESPPISPRSSSPKPIRPTLMRFHSANEAVTTGMQGSIMSSAPKEVPRKLRTVPLSVQDLRSPPSERHLQVKADAPRLLPSPDLHDGKVAASTSDTYYRVHDPVTGISPYENHSIISSYFEGPDTSLVKSPKRLGVRPLPIRAQTLDSVPQQKLKNDNVTKGSHIMRSTVKFEKQSPRDRSSTFPTESDWLAGTMQYCEDWLQGIERDQRRCQIVESSETEYNSDDPDAETDVKYATVIQTTRPKVVKVSRRCSVIPAEGEDDGDDQEDEHLDIRDIGTGPHTPSQEQHEKSAFSPWDSPNRDNRNSYATTGTDVTQLPILESPALPEQNPARKNRLLKRAEVAPANEINPQTRSVTELTSGNSSQIDAAESSVSPPPTSKSNSPSVSPIDSYFSLPSSSRTTATSISSQQVQSLTAKPRDLDSDDSQVPISSLSSNNGFPSRQPPASKSAIPSLTLREFDQILAQLTSAINTFPRDVLLLTSPAIIHLRSLSASSQSAELPLELLRRIFPTTEPLLLSAIAAAIISHDWLISQSNTSLPLTHIVASPPPTVTSPSSSGPKPSSNLHPSSFSNRVATALSDNKVSGQPDMAIPPTATDSEAIPPKARATLGIRVPSASTIVTACDSDGSTPTVTGATTPTPIPTAIPAHVNLESIMTRRPSVEDQANRKRLMHVLAAGFNVVIDDLIDAVVRSGSGTPMDGSPAVAVVSTDKEFVKRVANVVVLGCGVGSI